MAKRMLLKPQDRRSLFDIPTDEDSLIRHFTLSPSDRLEIEVRRRPHNRLGFAVQLCLMRYPGRALMANETPPKAMLNYVAEQIGTDPRSFDHYARRQETKTNHMSYLLGYLGLRSPTAEDRRAALTAAIDTALTTDSGKPIATAIISSFRDSRTLLPAANMIERIGLAARAIARRRAEAALIAGLSPEKLEALDGLLRLAASVTARLVAPSMILKRFSASSKSSNLAKALREIGRIERTLFMIEWYSSPSLRRRCQAGLNKGEAAHKLKRAVFFHERGEIRDRSYDSQAFRASGLNLVVSAIVHWNTVYLSRAVAHLRQRGRYISR